jgi:hypothetical protein
MKSKIFDNIYLLGIFCITFILWSFSLKDACSCSNKYNNCYRSEFFGVQLNHFVLFVFIGFFFPSYFFTFLFLGIAWEVYDYYLHFNTDFVFNYMGGCLGEKLDNNPNPIYNYKVYRNIPKYMNPIDKFFGIKNSTIHGWHHSVAEIVPNILGFLLGRFLYSIVS